MRRRQGHRRLPRRVGAAIGIVEQAEPLLGGEDPANGVVEQGHQRRISRQRRPQSVEVKLARHVHVDSGGERQRRRFRSARRDAVALQLGDAHPVAHHHPLPAPEVAQRTPHQRAIGGIGTESTALKAAMNDPAPARRRMKGRQIDLFNVRTPMSRRHSRGRRLRRAVRRNAGGRHDRPARRLVSPGSRAPGAAITEPR
jgi:hypothetical protein